MRNQSERESIIQYTNHLIEQNNDEIKSLKSRLDKIISNDEQRKILENIEELNQYNRRLTLRLEEPMLSIYKMSLYFQIGASATFHKVFTTNKSSGHCNTFFSYIYIFKCAF